MLANISRSGYRPLLQAGVRVFEWNGSMLHAKTAVADRQWARVGSSNLNIASWLNNREIDVAVEDAAFAKRMAEQYEMDLENATEIVLKAHPRHRGQRIHSNTSRAPRPRGRNGSSGRVAASALRIANTFGAALTQRRELGDTETGPLLGVTGALLLIAVIGTLWPAVIAWPLALFCAWLALNLGIRSYRMWRKRRGRFDP
jgi:cardiolipin synthase